MVDYKDTLNLPKTAFPMKANLAQREPKMQKRWQDAGLYQQIREKRQDKEKFIFHHGPPYANGAIHLGHALNLSLKDFVVKAKTLSGYDAPFVPGWDCHGLPIELNVEKKKGRVGQKISAKDFRKACREYALKQVEKQKEGFERLGVLADWKNPYLTMDYQYEADVLRALGIIIEKGYVEQGFKPVNWCLDCASALAEAEVEYQEKTSPSIDVRFRLVDNTTPLQAFKAAKNDKPISLPIWTTTPWTLPANEAVCLHPDLIYVLVDVGDEYLIVAEELLASFAKRCGIEDYRVIDKTQGEALAGQQLHHPFFDKQVPVILGEHVTTETGTGAVHTAPGHGEDDYRVGLKYDLPVNNPVDGRGVYFADVPLVGGQHIRKVNPFILELLEQKNNLLHAETLQHSYPHCWRHKTPLLFRATPQWFIRMKKHDLEKQALSAIKNVQWVPNGGETRITAMLESRPDWCISRQRTWGVPIAVFAHKQTGELHPNTVPMIEKIAQAIEQQGVDAWDEVNIHDYLGDDADDYLKVTDILDVWFDSGVTHFTVLDQRKELSSPADLYLEGSDQHRGWFQTSLLTSCAMKNEAPYKQVLTHGFTVDANGRKMSKSLGNIIPPDKVIQQLGADVLRLWVASTDYSTDITVSDEILKRVSDTYRRLRNTARFLLANLHDFNPKTDLVSGQEMLELDRWIVLRAQALQAQIKTAYDAYHFSQVYQLIYHFCSRDLGSFYLDVIKDRQYTCQTNSLARRSAQTALYHVIEAMVRWLAPIISFTAEEIFEHIPGEREDSVFLSHWYQFPEILPVDNSFWGELMLVRDGINKEIEQLRAEGQLGSSLEANITLFANEHWLTSLRRIQDELRFVFIVSSANLLPSAQANKAKPIDDIEGLTVTVQPTKAEKCVRCWHRSDSVGTNKTHPELCARCIDNIEGAGEKRLYA
jgi:isoleucyl-tRNA synthetase